MQILSPVTALYPFSITPGTALTSNYYPPFHRYTDPNKPQRYTDPNEMKRYTDPNQSQRYEAPNG